MQKTVLAIHDVSCVGRCSLTVALPILSACGIHAACLPTALLSTHTGEFTGYTCLDLTEEMARIEAHLATLPLGFDGLYTGFLGSYRQIELVGGILERRRSRAELIVVDPVMADEGRLYATYTAEMASGMGDLCRLADVITPNLTEACLLLGRPYIPDPDEKTVRGLLEALAARYDCRDVLLTGVRQGDKLGAAGFCAADGSFSFAGTERLPHTFYGTGDVFASALTGCLMRGLAMPRALDAAIAFTREGMLHTLENGLPLRYGVAFEQALPGLVRAVEDNA